MTWEQYWIVCFIFWIVLMLRHSPVRGASPRNLLTSFIAICITAVIWPFIIMVTITTILNDFLKGLLKGENKNE